jgi:hypothetical protein
LATEQAAAPTSAAREKIEAVITNAVFYWVNSIEAKTMLTQAGLKDKLDHLAMLQRKRSKLLNELSDLEEEISVAEANIEQIQR